MGLLQSLSEGFINAAGDETTRRQLQQSKDRKLAMADAFRANQIEQFEKAQQDIQSLLSSKQVMDNGNLRPLTEAEIADWTQKQQQIASHIQNLYNPSFDPGRNMVPEDPLHKLAAKVHLAKKRPAGEAKNAAQQKADLQGIVQKATPAPGTEEMQKAGVADTIRKQRVEEAAKAIKAAGGTDEDVAQFRAKVAEAAAGSPIPKVQKFYRSPDGKQADWYYPGEQPQGWQASSPTAMTPKPIKLTFHGNQAFMTDPATGTVYSQSNIASAPPEVQTIFADAMKAAAAYRHTEGEHTAFIWQGDKQVPVQVRTESSSGFGAAAPPAGTVYGTSENMRTGKTSVISKPAGTSFGTPVAPTPKPPAQQKKDLDGIRSKGKGNAGVVSVGEPVGYRKSTFDKSVEKEAGDTYATLQGAIDRQDTMHKNLADVLKGDQQAMISMVANHIGMTLGAQKGARINQAVWNEAVRSAPWIEVVKSQWFHEDANGDLVFDGYKTGVTLTAEQARQMVRLADEKVDTLAKHYARSKEMMAGREGAARSKGKVSLKKAMTLPENKGKSESQVRQHIEELGYEVIP